MSQMSNYSILNEVKIQISRKPPLTNSKSFDNSSKSTRATSKNILAVKNHKLSEKFENYGLYSGLVPVHQIEKEFIRKRYPKEETEESECSSSLEAEYYNLKKKIKALSQRKANVNTVKYYKEDGRVIEFPLFKEEQVKVNEYDDKVAIESAEDDFKSDEDALDYGWQKVENDLTEAFALIKKENINCLVNYKKYGKLFKKPRKKLDLRKNLPYVELENIEKNKNDD